MTGNTVGNPVGDTVGIIGGSGLYTLIERGEAATVETPYGEHSSGLTRGSFGGTDIVFLPRHGLGHAHPPHRVNYRANLWALASLGVTRVLAPCAAGALLPTLSPGSFVLPDQLVDRTSGRPQTFVESGAVHVGFVDPYCPELRAVLREAGNDVNIPTVDGGTMVVIDGPRFSTRAESLWYQRQGWALVNMTGHPEAVLARELALCYAPVAVVTDMDAGVDGGTPVTQAQALKTFASSLESLTRLLAAAVTQVPEHARCQCHHAVDDMDAHYRPNTSR